MADPGLGKQLPQFRRRSAVADKDPQQAQDRNPISAEEAVGQFRSQTV
jgi:hypothetical protein